MINSIILAVVHRKFDRMLDRTAFSCHGELPYGTISRKNEVVKAAIRILINGTVRLFLGGPVRLVTRCRRELDDLGG